ncbi:MAG TPA: hypothetical protein VGL19_23615 [Polyangiaceae bacterium]
MAQWRNGAMAQWRNGAMAQWRNGAMAQWRIRLPAMTARDGQRDTMCNSAKEREQQLSADPEALQTS